jgi:hypothetical protein
MYERTRWLVYGSTQAHQDERFLEGPVPLAWLQTAARLPGRSLHVGLLLWYVAGQSRAPTVHLSNTLCLRFGVDRNAKYRALILLEDAELITVKRKCGQSPVVTIHNLSRAR